MDNKKKKVVAVAMTTLLCVTTIQPIMAQESTILTLQQVPEQQGYPDIEVAPTNNSLLGDSVPTETSVEDIEINETNFPDEGFRNYLKGLSQGIDGKFTSDEIAIIKVIGINGFTNIKDLKGIEYFTSLTELSCSKTKITSLDVSKNTALKWLDCSNTKITSLDVSNNKALLNLGCSNTPLAYLNIGTNNNMTTLYKDPLTPVNLYITEETFNIKDKFPGIKLDKISNVGNATYDEETGIMSKFKIGTPITYIYDCDTSYEGKPQSIQVTLNTDALEINEANFPDPVFRDWLNYFSGGDDGKFTSSEISSITNINVNNYDNIKDLKGIEYFTSLVSLECYGTKITNLDISKNMALKILVCANTGITNLDISENIALETLDCSNTGITSLDVENNKALVILLCHNTGITNLDVSNNTALEQLACYNTGITTLDVSNNMALFNMLCFNTPLAYLNIGTNNNLRNLSKYDLKPINLNITESNFNIEEKFPGISVSKISAVDNATFNNKTGIMSDYEIGTPITYTYDCGKSFNGDEKIEVTLNLTDPRGDSTLSIIDSLSKAYDGNAISGTPTVSKSGSTGAVSYKWEKKVDDTEWKEMNSLPTDVGTYRVTATLAPDNDYKGIDSSPVEFTISEASNSLTKPLSIKGWTYGKPANEPSATTTFGSVTYLYSYSKDGIYSRIVPTDAGTWYVKVMVEGTDNYESFESTPVSFVIAPMNVLENNQITVPDITADTDIDKLVIKDGDKVLEQGTDYNVTKTQDDKKTTITITFKGNYTGTITKTYTEAEKVPSGDDNKPEEKVDVPTGDNTQTGLLTTISLLSIGCITFLTGKKRRKN